MYNTKYKIIIIIIIGAIFMNINLCKFYTIYTLQIIVNHVTLTITVDQHVTSGVISYV